MKARIKKKAWKRRNEFWELPWRQRDYILKRLIKTSAKDLIEAISEETLNRLQLDWSTHALALIGKTKARTPKPKMFIGQYILDADHNPISTTDTTEWARFFENSENRRVAHDKIGEVEVSTVFLGIDHSFGGGPPMIFESMTFGDSDEHMQRYSTWDQAKAGHEKLVLTFESKVGKPRYTEFDSTFLPGLKKL